MPATRVQNGLALPTATRHSSNLHALTPTRCLGSLVCVLYALAEAWSGRFAVAHPHLQVVSARDKVAAQGKSRGAAACWYTL